MKPEPCPRANELEALLTLPAVSTVPSAVRRHAETCPLCSFIVHALRAEADLLEEIRTAVRTSPDAETRQRVQELCTRFLSTRSHPDHS